MAMDDAIWQASQLLAEQGIEDVNLEALRGISTPRLSKREYAELIDDLVDDSQRS